MNPGLHMLPRRSGVMLFGLATEDVTGLLVMAMAEHSSGTAGQVETYLCGSW